MAPSRWKGAIWQGRQGHRYPVMPETQYQQHPEDSQWGGGDSTAGLVSCYPERNQRVEF
jgi:hypothetical protein